MRFSSLSRRLGAAMTLALAGGVTAALGTAAQAASQPYFTYANGWRVQQHPRELADVNGDGRADVVGFGDQGTYVSLGRIDRTFTPPRRELADFGVAQGWREGQHPRELADVNGDGRADIVGFGYGGTTVSYGRSDGGFTSPSLVLRDFGSQQGWLRSDHVRELADVNGDGRADIVGFGYSRTYVSYGRAGGGFTAPAEAVRDFAVQQGWRVGIHLRELADVNGDGRADIVGFGDAGTSVSYALPGGGFATPTLAVRDFGSAQGWTEQRTPRELGDLNGDGAEDIVGFGDAGTYVSYGRAGGGFTAASLKIRDFGTAQGWRVGLHERALADGNGDGYEDIVGFGNAGTYVSFGQPGTTLVPAGLILGLFGNDQGWTTDLYPRKLADVNGDNRAEVVGFGYSAMRIEMLVGV